MMRVSEIKNGDVPEGANSKVRGETTSRSLAELVAGILKQLENPDAKPLRDRGFDYTDFSNTCELILSRNLQVPTRLFHTLIRNFEGPEGLLNLFFVNTPAKNFSGELIRTEYFYSAFIRHGKRGLSFFELARRAYEESREQKLTNKLIYASYINVAGKNGQFEEAQKAFLEAKDRSLVNIVTYNSYIIAAGKNGQFEEAARVFEEAKNQGLANDRTLESYNGVMKARKPIKWTASEFVPSAK